MKKKTKIIYEKSTYGVNTGIINKQIRIKLIL